MGLRSPYSGCNLFLLMGNNLKEKTREIILSWLYQQTPARFSLSASYMGITL